MRVVREHIEEYGASTTIHGVRYLTVTNVHWIERFFWMLAIITCTIFCGVEISKLYVQSKETPVVTKISSTPTDVTEIPYPAITICPENKLLKQYDDKLRIIIEKLKRKKTLSEEEFLLAESASLILSCYLFKRDKNIINRTITQKNINALFQISLKLDDVFDQCDVMKMYNFSYGSKSCSDLFKPILTNLGVCFTKNLLKPSEMYADKIDLNRVEPNNSDIAENYWSPEYGYTNTNDTVYPESLGDFYFKYGYKPFSTFRLKINMKENPRVRSTLNRNKFMIFIHSPIEVPSKKMDYFYASPNEAVRINIFPDVTLANKDLIEYDPETRGCLFPEETNYKSVFKHHTRFNCFAENYANDLKEELNCSYYTLPLKDIDNIPTPYCNCYDYRSKPLKLHTCLPSCFEYKYQYQVTTSPLNTFINASTEFHFIEISYQFNDLVFYKKIKSKMYTFTDLLANVGGLMGIFTGFSLTSIIEITYFMSLRICCKIKRNKTKTKREELKEI